MSNFNFQQQSFIYQYLYCIMNMHGALQEVKKIILCPYGVCSLNFDLRKTTERGEAYTVVSIFLHQDLFKNNCCLTFFTKLRCATMIELHS